jgi:hypothetical protein
MPRSSMATRRLVGNGHPMRIARQISQYRRRPGERAFGIDHPLALAQRCEPCRRRPFASAQARRTHRRTAAGRYHRPGLSSSRKRRRNSRESTRTGRKKPRSAGDPTFPVRRQPAAGDDAMDMRMVASAPSPRCATPGWCQSVRPGAGGSAAMVRRVSAAMIEQQPIESRPCWYRRWR